MQNWAYKEPQQHHHWKWQGWPAGALLITKKGWKTVTNTKHRQISCAWLMETQFFRHAIAWSQPLGTGSPVGRWGGTWGQLMANTWNALLCDHIWVSCREEHQKEWEDGRLFSTSKWKVVLICLHWGWKHDHLFSEQNAENLTLFQPKVIISISVIWEYSSMPCEGQRKQPGLGCGNTFARTEFWGMWWHELQLNQETKEEGASYEEECPCIYNMYI